MFAMTGRLAARIRRRPCSTTHATGLESTRADGEGRSHLQVVYADLCVSDQIAYGVNRRALETASLTARALLGRGRLRPSKTI
jgi:hypothetical protein